ncbi:MAG: hypothetical protein Q8M31_17845 [Beijerinckiaceae bacterium]|nr:hypothetical protein [Beijerinckiaceae bacterium]
MFRLGLSARRASQPTQVRAQLKAQVARVMALEPDVTVSITEISCVAAGCPDSELVVLVLREGAPPVVGKLHGPMTAVSDQAIAEAFASFPNQSGKT